jgi:hypothetical protein
MQRCDGTLRAAEPGTCGAGTDNPDCDDICDGEIVVEPRETFGVIGEAGESFRLYLGGGIASNGVNCALLGWSVADAVLESDGSPETGDWSARAMSDGVVEIGYAGGCLWAGDPDLDGDTEALVLSAGVKFTTGFSATRR